MEWNGEEHMRIKKSVLIAVLVIAIIALGAFEYSLLSKTTPTVEPQEGEVDHHQPAISLPLQPLILVGSIAPDFVLVSLSGRTTRLSDYRKKPVILFFNEGSMCYPSCWSQMTKLIGDERLSGKATIFSIVVDSSEQWIKIVEKVPSMKSVDPLLDTSRNVSAAYGVLYTDSSMHKGSYPGHTYIIIDGEGTVRYVLDDPTMVINNDKLVETLSTLGG